jgi:leucyl-tRNA synthetase
MQDRYRPEDIEVKWQERWQTSGVFRVQEAGKDKYYVLEMLPYPSGRIHMGHVRNYTIGDVVARHLRMRGKTVLHPMGWDAFGMPAENAAMERGRHPQEWTYANIAQMRKQLQRLGLSYDWSREFATCDPDYYRHEQAMFIRMLERDLVYRKHALANWCNQCATVLANEQVEEGRCWRCGSEVVQRAMPQWFVRITKYAEELLQGIESLRGGWADDVLTMQRNWIGKSTGAEVRFELDEPVQGETELRVFTTRPDTLFGVTFMTLAAEHPLALTLAHGTGREAEVQAFVDRIRAEHKVKRAGEEEDKQGIFTGRFCRNPLTGQKVPIWIANFVLIDYGTGAVMAVPAHDQRDFDFAKRYGLPIRVVINPEGERLEGASLTQAYEDDGVMTGSGPFDGTPNREGMAKVVARLAEQKRGGEAVSYRLRDWLVSRQRYWGAPIPVIHCPKDGVVPVPLSDLPVVLPPDVTFTGEGGSPLARHPGFMRTTCPKCGSPAERESDTLDTFVESSWYFLRYTSPQCGQGPVDPAVARAWMPVDLYVGGKEHAVMHLLYARFWQRMMIDLGYLPSDTAPEPFTRLLNQGMVCREFYFRNDPENPSHKRYYYPEETELVDGIRKLKAIGEPVEVGGVLKMSKTKRNTVEPDQIIDKYGVDTARLFILFAAPPEGQLDWNDAGVEGAQRFLQRVWRLVSERRDALVATKAYRSGTLTEATADLRRVIHRTIQRVTYDLSERCQPNTAIAAQMELVNALTAFDVKSDVDAAVLREGVDTLLLLLSPFAPHIADELFEQLGGHGVLIQQTWPELDAAALEESSIEIPVQINGKLRGRVRVAPDATQDTVVAAARAVRDIADRLESKQIKKTVYVPGRILTIVVSDK